MKFRLCTPIYKYYDKNTNSNSASTRNNQSWYSAFKIFVGTEYFQCSTSYTEKSDCVLQSMWHWLQNSTFIIFQSTRHWIQNYTYIIFRCHVKKMWPKLLTESIGLRSLLGLTHLRSDWITYKLDIDNNHLDPFATGSLLKTELNIFIIHWKP